MKIVKCIIIIIWFWCWCSVHTGQQLITIRLFLNFAKSKLCFWVCGRQREVTVESWEVNMNHAAAERKSITRHKKKTPGFYHKEGFLWIHRTLSGAFISNQASFHAALKCTGTYKNHSRSRQRVGEVNMSKGSEITNKWGFYRFMFCWREKNSLTFYNIN